MKRLYLALILLVLATWPAYAQSPVTVIGPITANDCVKFNSTTIITDAGFICTGQGILPNATVAGTVLYYTGTAWVIFAGNTSGTNCLGENAVGAPQWTTCSGGSGANPGGSNTQIQYNASGTFGGLSTFTTSAGNLALTGGNLTITDSASSPATSNLKIDTPSTGQIGAVTYFSGGTNKWVAFGKDATDNLYLFDLARGGNDLTIATGGNMALMPSGGSIALGNSGYFDNSGHPYCDVRNFGAGTGSNSADQTAIANALSACSGGYVFFPCGAYGNTAPWTVPAFTSVKGAASACVSITTTNGSGDVFVCGSGGTNGPKPIEIAEMQIYGVGSVTTGTVPTAGYAIDCPLGGNQQSYYRLYINGTFNGIYIGGAGGRIRDSRLETLYGTGMIYAPVGGNLIDGNQLDNNSNFNATGGPGFGTFITYNTSSPVVVATGVIALSNGYFFVATVGGTTAPSGSGIPVSPIYKNITDGTVTWQMVGNQNLALVTVGTESWITDNDMTSPANVGVLLVGSNSANRTWIRGNDFGGEISAGIYLSGGVAYTHILDNQFQSVGYKVTTVSTGIPIWDAGGGDNQFTVVNGNTFTTTADASIFVQSDYWNITGNSIAHNQKTSQYCGINIQTSGSSPIGTNITGNNIFNISTDAICTTGGGGSNTIVVGNAVFGGTIFLSGTNSQAGNL